MATVQSGELRTDVLTSTLMPREVDDKLHHLYADEAQFIQVMRYFGGAKTVNNYKFEMYEQDMEAQTTLLTAGASAGAATIAVTTGTGKYFVEGSQIIVEEGTTDTRHTVTGVSTDTLTIDPVVPSGDYTSGDTVRILGKAKEEGGTIGDGYYVEPDAVYNYTEQIWDAYEISDRLANTNTYYSKDMLRTYKDQMNGRFMRQLEKRAFWGKRGTDTLNSKPISFTGGLKDFISSYAVTGSGITESGFLTMLKNTTATGSNKRVMFCGGTMLNEFIGWKVADRVVDNRDMSKKLGFNIDKFVSPYCELYIVRSKMIDQVESDCAFIVDPANIGLRQLSPKRMWKGIEDPGQMGSKGAISWDVGFHIGVESAHTYIYSIT